MNSNQWDSWWGVVQFLPVVQVSRNWVKIIIQSLVVLQRFVVQVLFKNFYFSSSACFLREQEGQGTEKGSAKGVGKREEDREAGKGVRKVIEGRKEEWHSEGRNQEGKKREKEKVWKKGNLC